MKLRVAKRVWNADSCLNGCRHKLFTIDKADRVLQRATKRGNSRLLPRGGLPVICTVYQADGTPRL